MTVNEESYWLAWAREIQALGQTGLTYCQTEYDRERYERMLQISAEIVHARTELPREPVLKNFRVQPGYATPKVDVRGAVVRDGKRIAETGNAVMAHDDSPPIHVDAGVGGLHVTLPRAWMPRTVEANEDIVGNVPVDALLRIAVDARNLCGSAEGGGRARDTERYEQSFFDVYPGRTRCS